METLEDAKLSLKKWFPFNKGGNFRRWYGNNDYIVNYENDGAELKLWLVNNPNDPSTNSWARYLRSPDFYFKPSINWSEVTSSVFSARYSSSGFIFSDASNGAFCQKEIIFVLAGLLNSGVVSKCLEFTSPTLNFGAGDIGKLPVIIDHDLSIRDNISKVVEKCISISRQDWDNFETSWDFKTHPLTRYKTNLIQQAFENWQQQTESAFQQLKQLEEENNRYWIAAYGLQDELTPEVPDAQITIRRADLTRDIKSLLSYAVGCIMGRYALESEGLRIDQLRITNYELGEEETSENSASSISKEHEPTPNSQFVIRNSQIRNSIIPITDKAYFTDDIVDQIIEFLKTAYSPQHLQANLDYIAIALTLRTGENSRDRIRRYFLDEFVKDHIQTYKKRPIYWYFTSGKKKAFGALVYLHSYDTNTLARLRTDYVLELQRKIDNELQREQQNLTLLTTTATKKASQKLIKDLQDQQLELREYQAKLQHAADKRIAIDLDDGVAYNYTLFEGLVYEGAELKMADLKKKSEWKRKNQ